MMELTKEQSSEIQKLVKWSNPSITGEYPITSLAEERVNTIRIEVNKFEKFSLLEISEMATTLTNTVLEQGDRTGYPAISDITTFECG